MSAGTAAPTLASSPMAQAARMATSATTAAKKRPLRFRTSKKNNSPSPTPSSMAAAGPCAAREAASPLSPKARRASNSARAPKTPPSSTASRYTASAQSAAISPGAPENIAAPSSAAPKAHR